MPPVAEARKRLAPRQQPGEPGYTGCHNCGSQTHLARNCPVAVSDSMAALLAAPEMLAVEDAEEFLAQGLHPETELVTDPQAFEVLCAALVHHAHDASLEEKSA